MYVYKVPLHVRFKDMSHYSPVFNTYIAQYYNLYAMKWFEVMFTYLFNCFSNLEEVWLCIYNYIAFTLGVKESYIFQL